MPEISGYDLQQLQKKADAYDSGEQLKRWIVRGIIGLLVFLILSIGGCAYGKPQYNRYKAETQKKVLIAEARAKADAAKYEADRAVEIAKATAEADRSRAEGIADANRTIAASLTPEYIQWKYVDQMDELAKQAASTVVYVPRDFPIQPVAQVEAGK